ncbi:metallophosphoesterase [Megasphaera cerevisiae]|nr:metallophosphoesterase [Megasphaera cerevisiae]
MIVAGYHILGSDAIVFNRYTFFWKLGGLTLIGNFLMWWMYRSAFSFLYPWWSLIAFIILSFCFPLSHNAIHDVPVWAARCFSWIGGYWLIFTIYSVLGACIYFLLYVTVSLLGDESVWNAVRVWISNIVFILVMLILIAGSWRAFHPVYHRIEVTTEKEIPETTIAFLTDTHFSPLLSHWYAKKMVRHINAIHADAVIFGGDIIDAHLDFIYRDQSYLHLMNIKAPLGVYAVYGNHDYFDSDLRKEAALFSSFRFLCNDRIYAAAHIAITGLNDYMHEPVDQLPAVDKRDFNIAVDHEPLRIIPAEKQGYDMYLAGHTHGGQFFPETYINKRLYTLNYGCRRFGHLLAIVSSGYGFWGIPVRTGPSPEIVLLHLRHNSSSTTG